MSKSTGRDAPLFNELNCHDERFVLLNDKRRSSTSFDMSKQLSRETPAVSEIGGDLPTPILCYEANKHKSAKCYANFRK